MLGTEEDLAIRESFEFLQYFLGLAEVHDVIVGEENYFCFIIFILGDKLALVYKFIFFTVEGGRSQYFKVKALPYY